MSLKTKIKEIEEKIKIQNFTKYVFKKKVFRFSILLLVLLWGVVIIINKGIVAQEYSFTCERDICENPFYTLCVEKTEMVTSAEEMCDNLPEEHKNRQFLFQGEKLEQQNPFIVEYFNDLVLLVLIGAFVLNHLLYNVGGKK